jgi:hypothetical protein
MVGNSSFFKYRDTTVFMFVEEIILNDKWLKETSNDQQKKYEKANNGPQKTT